MKRMKVLEDPEAFQLLADDTRRKMVFLLRVKEMTVSQIASELNITPQAVYHHIKKLQKKDLVEVVREERLGHLIESYYQATAESFCCSVGNVPSKADERVRTILDALETADFNLERDEEAISQLIEVRKKLSESHCPKKLEKAISELDSVDVLTKPLVQEYAEILLMSDEEFAEQQALRKKFRELLISMVKR